VLGTVSLFFKDAVERGLAASNPAAFKRKKVKGGTISTFAPEEAERILHGVDEDLRAFLAIIFFSGVRKEEAARLTWTQLNAASRACRPPGDRWPCPSTRLRPW
jgi:integrase